MPGGREILVRDKGLGHHWLVGTPILWLLASGGSVRSLSGQLAHPFRRLAVSALASLLVATSRTGPTSRWLSCYVVGPLGPLLESYSMKRSLTDQ